MQPNITNITPVGHWTKLLGHTIINTYATSQVAKHDPVKHQDIDIRPKDSTS